MSNTYPLDFNDINFQALSNIIGFLKEWLPGGSICGHDYCPLNPTRTDKHQGSFRINIKTAQWHDFATGDKGCGLISLYAYIKNITFTESAKFIAETINYKRGQTMIEQLKFDENKTYNFLTLDKNTEYKSFMNAAASWAYRDLEGNIIYIVDRFNTTNGNKLILPRCYVSEESSGKRGWLQKKLLDHNMLYNQEEFTDKKELPVLMVEGEKSCEAAKKIYGDKFWCTTWCGGAQGVYKLNCDLIKNRKVYLMPDNDTPGKKAMEYLANHLSINNDVFMVDYPASEFPESWDIADSLPPCWTYEMFASLFDKAVPFNKHVTNTSVAETKAEVKSETLTLDTKPYEGEVNGLELVNELIQTIKQHVVVRNEEAIAIAYWILQTYNINAFMYAPRLLIISPEKRCGKTTLLQLLEMLCYKAWPIGNCTPAVLYKAIQQEQPTVLIDEADSFFNNNNDMRNIINVGFQGKFGVARSGGKNFEIVKSYKVFTMMAIAAINNLPDTIMDRGIKIAMRRKLPNEKTLPLRERTSISKFEIIKQKCRKLMLTIGSSAGDNIIDSIKGLNDRACDVWEGMISIACLLGDEERVIKAAVKLSQESSGDGESIKNILLKHILQIFKRYSFEDISSSNLIQELILMEDAPWSEINKGRPLTAHKLAYLLKEYKISTFQKNEFGKNVNHYRYTSFLDAFERYIPDELEKIKKATEDENPWEFQKDSNFTDIK